MPETPRPQPAAISATGMRQALDAVHDESLKVLSALDELPAAIPAGIIRRVELIASIARYKHDLRTDEEKADGAVAS